MKILVVDDEPLARRRLVRMLSRLKMEDIEVAGEAGNAEEALEKIESLAPDVVLLDIRMPGMDGIELCRRVRHLPHVIFTTAHEEYAVQAFEAEAVDYLLKPVEAARLQAALERVRRLGEAPPPVELEAVLRRLLGKDDPERLTARSGNELRVFDPAAITRLQAREGYTAFRSGGREYLLEESIASLEGRLADLGFVRIHRGELVNIHHVQAIQRRGEVTLVELSDGQQAPVSRRLLPDLKRRLGLP